MSKDYNIIYILTNQRNKERRVEIVNQLNTEVVPNLDIVFGYIARKEPELEKNRTLHIMVQSPGEEVITLAEFENTPIKQMLKRQGLKQILTARKSGELMMTLTIEIGATNNPVKADCYRAASAPAELEFIEASRLAKSGNIGAVYRLLENYNYDCTITLGNEDSLQPGK
jgi:hypothetical protein